MRYSPAIRIVLAAGLGGMLGLVLSYVEAASLGIAGDGHLWNMAFGLVTLMLACGVFSYWFANRWWFWPDQSVDQ